MEKKRTILALVFVGVVIACAVALIIFTGITAREYNYVMIEINPRVEFLCDSSYKVVSFKALNEDARIVLSDIDYTGIDIATASTDFIDQCARCGYIDVDGENNAVNVTIIDGLTQALDVHVVEHIYTYLQKKEILCAVCENYEDRDMFDEKNENKVSDINKYKLIKRICEMHPDINKTKLAKLSEIELIDMISNIHYTFPDTHDNAMMEIKKNMIDDNASKYENHMEKITDKTQQKFSSIFDKYQKTIGERYRQDFEKEYDNWQLNHIN